MIPTIFRMLFLRKVIKPQVNTPPKDKGGAARERESEGWGKGERVGGARERLGGAREREWVGQGRERGWGEREQVDGA